ncbi:MAG: hypothetical protein IT385_06470 [Deltaproteobacteria bacterium]|nr:hypothetical protein [Deltaproteobacteria bacterium]
MTLIARTAALAPALVILFAVAADPAAHADALPPDERCPSGQVWVRGHSGGCRPEAPDDCAPGWRGKIGGVCVVAMPDVGASPPCPEDEVPKAVTLCLERRLDHGNGRLRYDPPREYEAPVGIVGPSAPCDGADRRAVAGEVCVDPEHAPTAFVTPPADPKGPRVVGGTGCGRGCEAGSSATAAALLAALGLALTRLARRRRRRA